MQESALFEKLAQSGGIMRPEFLAVAEGQLEGGAFQVRQEDFQILWVDVGVLG